MKIEENDYPAAALLRKKQFSAQTKHVPGGPEDNPKKRKRLRASAMDPAFVYSGLIKSDTFSVRIPFSRLLPMIGRAAVFRPLRQVLRMLLVLELKLLALLEKHGESLSRRLLFLLPN